MSYIERFAIAVSVISTMAMPGNTVQAQPRWRCVQPMDSTAISLPADDRLHEVTPQSFEWFYWTSHLEAADGRQFGILQIIYSVGAELEPGVFAPILYADATVSDLSEQKYHYSGRAYNYAPPTPLTRGFDLAAGEIRARGGAGRDRLQAVVDDGERRYEVDLKLISLKTPVEELAQGYISEYARTRMLTVGSIRVDGALVAVKGWSVFDHAFGDMQAQLAEVDNWTWISLQLEDGRELLLLKAIRLNGSTLEYAILTDAQCRVKRFDPTAYTLTPTAHWRASETCEYPVAWTVSIPEEQLDLNVSAAIRDQDIFLPGVDHYYEGEVTALGRGPQPARGRGVVELTWFCPW